MLFSNPVNPPDLKSKELIDRLSKEFGVQGVEYSKDQLTALGLGTAAMASLPFFAEAIVPLATLGLIFGWKAYKAPDETVTKAIQDANLAIAQQLWNDPASKRVMTTEIKGLMRDVYGIDFSASLQEHKANLSQQLQDYVDMAIQTSVSDQDQLASKIGANINASLTTAVDGIINYMQDAKNKEVALRTKEQYNKSELQGGIYLASLVSDKLLGQEAGKVVETVANAAVGVMNIMSSVSMCAMGPIGAAAGCVNIAMSLISMFSSSGPSPQQIMYEAIGQVQKSIRSLHQDMATWFGIVVDNQKKMLEDIDNQFELLRQQNAQNYAQILENLKEINQALLINIDEQREGFRNEDRKTFNSSIESLYTSIINKRKETTSLIKQNVEAAIEAFFVYGTQVSSYEDFIGVSTQDISSIQWLPDHLASKFSTIDRIDYFIGTLPIITYHFTGKKITTPNNLEVLGRAASAIAVAYSEFPQIAKKSFEVQNRHYLDSINNGIETSLSSISTALNQETIQAVKNEYFRLINLILDDAIKSAYDKSIEATKMGRTASVGHISKISAIAPLDNVSLVQNQPYVADLAKSGMSSVCFPNQSGYFEKYVPRGPRYYVSIYVNAWPSTNMDNFTFMIKQFKGTDPSNTEKLVDFDDLFVAAEKAYILTLEPGATNVRHFSVDTYPGFPNINVHVDADEYFTPHKIIFPQEDNQILGDGVNTGWLKSTLKNIVITCQNGRQMPQSDLDVQLLSRNLIVDGQAPFTDFIGRGPREPHTPDLSFPALIVDRMNLYCNVRKGIIDNSGSFIRSHPSINEFEAVASCLKYLAGLNTYVKTGDITIGTSLAKSSYSVTDSTLISIPANRQDFQSFINIVTSKNYIYKSNNVSKRGSSNPEIKEYIKNEIESALNQYVDAYLPSTMDKIRLPEVEVPRLMLTAAKQFIK